MNMHRILGFATACLLPITAAKADFVPLSHEQNLALIADFMTGNFFGDDEFKSCAQSWRQGIFETRCKAYLERVEVFAKERAGSLDTKLLNNMIDYYMGLDEVYSTDCRLFQDQEHADCMENRRVGRSRLLEEFKDAYR
ncbi:hypothetical protein ABVF61_08020 [Roseibium sp. HPY-6]|uniref:hypothetical protein n=1 Tax=Roseibium sp. HPY-6 TaxID=3229852 RepID=UPI00338FEEA6